jgi:histone H3/H4
MSKNTASTSAAPSTPAPAAVEAVTNAAANPSTPVKAAPKGAKGGKANKGAGKAASTKIRISRDNGGVTKNGFERLARKAGVVRTQRNVHADAMVYLRKELYNMLGKATRIATYNKRVTIAAADTALALSLTGREILGICN